MKYNILVREENKTIGIDTRDPWDGIFPLTINELQLITGEAKRNNSGEFRTEVGYLAHWAILEEE